jgi:RNA polymerase sigma factor (sigma-70 family)
MSQLSDNELIKMVKENGSEPAFLELINRYEKLYYSVVQKFHSKHPESNLQDLLSDSFIVFNDVINKYNIDKKTKFSTFLYYMTRFHCLNTYKKVKQEISYENKDIDIINENNNKFYTFHNNCDEINNYVFKILEKMKDKRIGLIFKKRFIDLDGDKLTPWSRIGNDLNLSTTMIITLYQRGQKYLYQKLSKDKNKI